MLNPIGKTTNRDRINIRFNDIRPAVKNDYMVIHNRLEDVFTTLSSAKTKNNKMEISGSNFSIVARLGFH